MSNSFSQNASLSPSASPSPMQALATPEASQVVTLSDIVSVLLDRCMAPTDDARTIRLLTTATQQAIRDLPKRGKWKHYTGIFRFRSSAQTTHAVSYVESTKTMTITDGSTWPADVVAGEILYGNIPFEVTSRVSDTVVILANNGTIGSNYTGNVQWQRQRYNFGRMFSKLHYLINLDNRLPLAFIDIPTFYERQRLVRFAGIPSLYTLRNSQTQGWTDIVLSPSSLSSFLFEGNVSYLPTIPTIYQKRGTNGAATSGSFTFTSSGANFTADSVGAVLRIYSSEQDVPFGLPVFESFITARNSSTQLTLAMPADQNYTNAVYVVSSHIDIDVPLLRNYVENCAYSNYCQNHKHDGLAQAKAVEKASLMEALASDSKINHSTSREFAWSLAMARPSEYAQITGPAS